MKQNLTFVNCYFQEEDNEDIGTTHSVQQQNLFNVSNVLILTVTSKRQSYPYTGLERPSGPQEVDLPRISRQLAYEGGMGEPYARSAFTPKRYSW
jgi:hypothetical protein